MGCSRHLNLTCMLDMFYRCRLPRRFRSMEKQFYFFQFIKAPNGFIKCPMGAVSDERIKRRCPSHLTILCLNVKESGHESLKGNLWTVPTSMTLTWTKYK